MFDMCLTIRFCVMKSDSNTPLAGTCTSTSYLQPLSKSSACFGSSPRSWATAGKRCPPPSKVSSIPPNFSACRNRILADERPGAVRTKEPRLALAFMPFWLAALIACVGSVASAQALSDDGALKTFAVHINRTPPQSWPGYGVLSGQRLCPHRSPRSGKFRRDQTPCSHCRAGSSRIVDQGRVAGNDRPYADVHRCD